MTTMLNNLFEWAKVLLQTLFLSATSPRFYSDNFQNYTGYGVKYLLTISLICSFIITVPMLMTANKLSDYFTEGKLSNTVVILDHVINQFPTLEYDGKSISTPDETPIILNDPSNKQLIIIDPENKTPFNDKSKIPVYISSNKLTVNVVSSDGSIIKTFPFLFQSILGKDPVTINPEYIRAYLADLASAAPKIIIFIIYPALGLLIFSNAVIQNTLSIVILFALSYLYGKKSYLSNCIRIVFFSAGIVSLTQVSFAILLPSLATSLWFIQLWTHLLLIIGLTHALAKKDKNNSLF